MHGEREKLKEAERTRKLHELLRDSKATNKELNAYNIEGLRGAGVVDFSGVSLSANLEFLNWLPPKNGAVYDFSNANLNGATFNRCDLRGADFSEADMTYVRFRRCELSGAKMSTVQIKGEIITSGEPQVVPGSWHVSEKASASLMARFGCKKAEEKYREIFEMPIKKGEHFGEGIVLTVRGLVVGVLKRHAELSFLATRTTYGSNGDALFLRGGLYDLDDRFIAFIIALAFKQGRFYKVGEGGVWPVADIEKVQAQIRKPSDANHAFYASFIRFLREPALFKKLPEWHALLEASRNEIQFSES